MELSLPMGISIREMPLVDAACKCVAPLVFECGDYIGVLGTCFAVQGDRGDVVFLCAKHSLKGVDGNSVIKVLTGLSPKPQTSIVANVKTPRVTVEAFDEAGDFAVLRPATPPVFSDEQFCPIPLGVLADMDDVRPGAFIAVAGHPRDFPDSNLVDYDKKELTLGILLALGKYCGPSPLRGCHLISLDTRRWGGPNGLSGSPAFRVVRHEGQWVPLWAGVVIQGGPKLVHFIDARYPVEFLLREKLLAA